MGEEENKSKNFERKFYKMAFLPLILAGAGLILLVILPVLKAEFLVAIGIVAFSLLLITALIAGIIIDSIIHRNRNQMKGRIICWLGTVIALVLIVYVLIPPPAPSRHLARRIVCGCNLKGIGQNLFLHAQEHERKYPEPNKWCDTLIKYAKLEENCFICRGATRSDINSTCHYSINPNCRPDSPNDVVLLFETKAGWNQHGGLELLTLENHQGKGCNVLFADGHVEWVKAEDVNNLRWEVNEAAVQSKTGDKAPGLELSDQER